MKHEIRIEEESQIVRLLGPVLVATDLGPGSDEPLRQGHALANALGGLLHVCQ